MLGNDIVTRLSLIIAGRYVGIYGISNYNRDMNKLAKASAGVGEQGRVSLMGFAKALTNVGLGVGLFSGVVAASGAKMAMDWQTTMAHFAGNTRIGSGSVKDMRKGMSQMQRDVFNLSKSSGANLDDLAAAYRRAVNSGFEPFGQAGDQAFTVVKAGMESALAAGASVGDTVNALAGVMHAFSIPANQAFKVMDMLHTTAAEGNMSLQDLMSSFTQVTLPAQTAGLKIWDFAAGVAELTKASMPAAQAVTQVKNLIMHIQRPSSSIQNMLWGLNDHTLYNDFTLSGLRTRGVTGVLDDIRSQIKSGHITEQQAYSLIPAMRGGTSMEHFLSDSGNSSLKKIQHDLLTGSGITQRTYDLWSKTAQAQIQKLGANLRILGIEIGQALLPEINSFIKGLLPIVQHMEEWVSHNKELVVWLLKLGLIIGGSSVIIRIFISTFEPLKMAVTGAISVISKYYGWVNSLSGKTQEASAATQELAATQMPAAKTAMHDAGTVAQDMAQNKFPNLKTQMTSTGTVVSQMSSQRLPALNAQFNQSAQRIEDLYGNRLPILNSEMQTVGNTAQTTATGKLATLNSEIGTVGTTAETTATTQLTTLNAEITTVGTTSETVATEQLGASGLRGAISQLGTAALTATPLILAAVAALAGAYVGNQVNDQGGTDVQRIQNVMTTAAIGTGGPFQSAVAWVANHLGAHVGGSQGFVTRNMGDHWQVLTTGGQWVNAIKQGNHYFYAKWDPKKRKWVGTSGPGKAHGMGPQLSEINVATGDGQNYGPDPGYKYAPPGSMFGSGFQNSPSYGPYITTQTFPGVNFAGQVTDTDYGTGQYGGQPVSLPEGFQGTLVRRFVDSGAGGELIFRLPNGGYMIMQHIQNNAAFRKLTLGQYGGGPLPGIMSGHPLKGGVYSGGTNPNTDWHLCIITDNRGRTYLAYLNRQQIQNGQGTPIDGGYGPGPAPTAPPPAGTASKGPDLWKQYMPWIDEKTYKPIVKQLANLYKVPLNLIEGILSVEHGNQTSPAGALGFMQVMPDRAGGSTRTIDGKTYNLNDPRQNLEAGVHLFSDLLKEFGGNVVDAIAGYNAGDAAVKKYGGIPPYKETQQYVPAVQRVAAAFGKTTGYLQNFDLALVALVAATKSASDAWGQVHSNFKGINLNLLPYKDQQEWGRETIAAYKADFNKSIAQALYDYEHSDHSHLQKDILTARTKVAQHAFLEHVAWTQAKANTMFLESAVWGEKQDMTAIKRAWQGIDPSTLKGKDRQAYIKDMERANHLQRQIWDNQVKIWLSFYQQQEKMGLISKKQFEQYERIFRETLANDAKWEHNQNAKAKNPLLKSLNDGRITPVRVIGHCDAEKANLANTTAAAKNTGKANDLYAKGQQVLQAGMKALAADHRKGTSTAINAAFLRAHAQQRQDAKVAASLYAQSTAAATAADRAKAQSYRAATVKGVHKTAGEVEQLRRELHAMSVKHDRTNALLAALLEQMKKDGHPIGPHPKTSNVRGRHSA